MSFYSCRCIFKLSNLEYLTTSIIIVERYQRRQADTSCTSTTPLLLPLELPTRFHPKETAQMPPRNEDSSNRPMIYRLWKEIRPRNLKSGGGVRKKLLQLKMP